MCQCTAEWFPVVKFEDYSLKFWKITTHLSRVPENNIDSLTAYGHCPVSLVNFFDPFITE